MAQSGWYQNIQIFHLHCMRAMRHFYHLTDENEKSVFFFGLFVSIQCLRGAFRILSEMACFQNHCATADSMSSTFDPHMCELIQFGEFISKFNLFETSKLH